jgi:hypothetical protein
MQSLNFRLDVENSDYHQLSQVEIGGAKRIYRHLSEPERPALLPNLVSITDFGERCCPAER